VHVASVATSPSPPQPDRIMTASIRRMPRGCHDSSKSRDQLRPLRRPRTGFGSRGHRPPAAKPGDGARASFGIDGPLWLVKPNLAFLLVILTHIWKFLPFWTLILLAGRMAIPKDHYEAASVDGATRLQVFRFITFPALKNLYITSTLLSTIWSVGDFNSVYLLTGGGPWDATHVLSTLGIRYAFNIGDIPTGVATVITALPLVIPIVVVLIRRLGRGE